LENERKQEFRKKLLGWLVSGTIHFTIICLLSVLVYKEISKDEELPPTRIVSIQFQKEEVVNRDKVSLREEKTSPTEIDIEEKTELETNISTLEPISEQSMSEDDILSDSKKGREEAVADSEMGGMGAFMTIGPGGSSAGMYGKRIGGGDKRTIGKAFGKNAKGVTSGIDLGLRWLKKHQSPNGSWSAKDYYLNCNDDAPKCEPGQTTQGGDEAMTGYALLCFLGAGYDHKVQNPYKSTVRKGIDHLLSIQKENGLIGVRNYEHPIAAMALIEAYGMTKDPSLLEAAQKAVNIIIERQLKDEAAKDSEYSGLGWDYVAPKMTRVDLSVTGWNVMALKSAKGADLNIGNSLSGAKNAIERTWKAANPNWKSIDPYSTSVFPYVWNVSTDKTEKDHLSFAGACMAVFLGHDSGDVMLESLLNDMDKRWLDTDKWKNNSYCLYYSSLAAFISGNHWNKWSEKYVPYLLSIQYTDKDGACKAGTWNYMKQDFHGAETSRVLHHCYYLLSLQVAVRYNMVNNKK
jgi:hypothetical protein